MSYNVGHHISFTKTPPFIRVHKLRDIGERIVFFKGQFDAPEPAFRLQVRVA